MLSPKRLEGRAGAQLSPTAAEDLRTSIAFETRPVASPQAEFRIPRQAAFTLVELLTVIAIIGLLAAILTPVVGRARASARNARCLANLREIGAACVLYAHDNSGRLPPPGNPAEGPQNSWIGALHRYTGAPFPVVAGEPKLESVNDIFRCPEWTYLDTEEPTTVPSYSMWAESYGGAVDWTRGRAISSIHDPSQTLLVIEYDESAFAAETPAWRSGGAYLSSPEAGGARRHGEHANYLFVDGHVSGKTPDMARMCFPQ